MATYYRVIRERGGRQTVMANNMRLDVAIAFQEACQQDDPTSVYLIEAQDD